MQAGHVNTGQPAIRSIQIQEAFTSGTMPPHLEKLLSPTQQGLAISQKAGEVLKNAASATEAKGLDQHVVFVITDRDNKNTFYLRADHAAEFLKPAPAPASPGGPVHAAPGHQPSHFETRLRSALEAELTANTNVSAKPSLPNRTERQLKGAVAKLVKDIETKEMQDHLRTDIADKYTGIKNGTFSLPVQEKNPETPHICTIRASIEEVRENYGGGFVAPNGHPHLILPASCKDADGNEMFTQDNSPTFLGEGSFSKVIMALDLHTMEIKAFGIFKTPDKISPEKALSDSQKQLTIREKLEEKHPKNEPFPFLLMEGAVSFVGADGTQQVAKIMPLGTLSMDKLAEDMRDPDNLEPILNVAEDMFNSVMEFQQAGYIHQDVKPENFLMTTMGVKLADFDSAQTSQEIVNDILKNKMYKLFGTVIYMRPGQIIAYKMFEDGLRLMEKAKDLWNDNPGLAMKYQQQGLVKLRQAAKEAASLMNDRYALMVSMHEMLTGEYPPFIQGPYTEVSAEFDSKAEEIKNQWEANDPDNVEGLNEALSTNHHEMEQALFERLGDVPKQAIEDWYNDLPEGTVMKAIAKLVTKPYLSMAEIKEEFLDAKNNMSIY